MHANADRPGRAVLIFDGDCAFCTSSVEWLRARLPEFPTAQPYQWADLQALALSEADAAAKVWLITPSARYGGHLAVAALLRRQTAGPSRFLGWLGTVPPWSWAACLAYSVIARNRHRLPGGTPACQLKPRS